MGREFAPSGTEISGDIYFEKTETVQGGIELSASGLLILSSTARPRFHIFLNIYSNKYKIKR